MNSPLPHGRGAATARVSKRPIHSIENRCGYLGGWYFLNLRRPTTYQEEGGGSLMSNEKLDVVACQHRFWKLLSKHATEVREDLFDNSSDAGAGRLCAEGLRIRALAHT